jgi:hypothetical protein
VDIEPLKTIIAAGARNKGKRSMAFLFGRYLVLGVAELVAIWAGKRYPSGSFIFDFAILCFTLLYFPYDYHHSQQAVATCYILS